MTSTDYTVDPSTAEMPVEQDEQVKSEAAAVSPLEDSDNLGAPLLLALLGGMALVLAVLTPVGLVKFAGVLIVVVAVAAAFRLLRRGGGSR